MIGFLLLIVSSSVAVVYTIPKQVAALRQAGVVFAAPLRLAVLQGLVLCAVAAGVGSALHAYTGLSLLRPPAFIVTTSVASLVGFLGHLTLYYLVFRPRIPRPDVLRAERIRLRMGLPARMLHGGIAEEVQFRWGLMSTFLALAKVVFPPGACCLLPIALLASALLFGIVHLVGARQIGLARSNAEKRLIMTDNVWGGIVFGLLLWSSGLVAAMISHALLHAAWFPIEKSVYQRDVAGRADSGPSAGIARS